MTVRIGSNAQNAAVSAVTALLNSGTIQVRTGTQPATVGTAATGTLLATLGLSATAFGAASAGSAAANAITGDTSADATGTAGWFRAYTSGSTGVIDGSVTASGGGGDMTFDSVSFVAGGTVNLTGWTFSQPAG